MKKCSGVVLLLLSFLGSAAFAQSLYMRAEQLTVDPALLTSDKCVQIGIFFSTEDVGTAEDWAQITSTIDYTLMNGAILASDPVVEISDFIGTNNPSETGIAAIAAPIAGSACVALDVINSATLGGSDIPYMPNAANPASAGNEGFATENVNNVTQTITASRLVAAGSIFQTNDLEEYLFAIVSVEFDQTTPVGSFVEMNFRQDPGVNIINRTGGALDALGLNTDGFALIFAQQDCVGAVADDNIGGASGSNIGIDYLDPMAGGIGGDITLTMPHAGNDPDQIRIVPSDGSGEIILTGGQIGAGSSTLSLSTQGDGTPVVGGPVTYQIFYGLNSPMGMGIIEGAPCDVTVNWNAPTCSVVFDTIPIVGMATNLDVTLSNVVFDGGNSRYGTVSGPAGSADLTAPMVTGNSLFFDDALSIAMVSAGDVGAYQVGDATGADGNAVTGCSTFLGLMCPTNNTVCPVATATIGGMLTITLTGDNVADWDITYNGLTTNVPGATPTFDVTPIDGNATDVTITANGFDPMGNPCDETIVCPIDFVAPTCGAATQNPDSTVTPVDVGTVITLTLVTNGAVSAAINMVPMTPSVGTPGVDDMITWTANYTAIADETVTATITGPDGDSTTCSWMIDINCEEPQILSLGGFGTTGIVIGGTAGCTYTVTVSQGGVVLQTFDVPVGMDGTGSDPNFVVPADVCINVGQLGQIIAPPGCDTGARTVPTLGEWALIAFAMLLMATGVVYSRRRRLS
jgi:hypothetical protein